MSLRGAVAAFMGRSLSSQLLAAMTIRDRLNRRIYPASMIALAFSFALGWSVMAMRVKPMWGFVVLISLLGLIGCNLYVRFGTRCPRCTNSIGYLIYLPKGGYSKLSKYLRFCPFCGTSLEAESDQTEQPYTAGATQ